MLIAVRSNWSVVNATDSLNVTKNTVSTKQIVVIVNALTKIVVKNFCLRSTVGSTKMQISAQHATKSLFKTGADKTPRWY